MEEDDDHVEYNMISIVHQITLEAVIVLLFQGSVGNDRILC